MLVGCDYHPASNKLPMSIRKRENCKSGELGTARKWKPVDTHAGLNDCSRKFYRDLAAQGLKVHVGGDLTSSTKLAQLPVCCPARD